MGGRPTSEVKRRTRFALDTPVFVASDSSSTLSSSLGTPPKSALWRRPTARPTASSLGRKSHSTTTAASHIAQSGRHTGQVGNRLLPVGKWSGPRSAQSSASAVLAARKPSQSSAET